MEEVKYIVVYDAPVNSHLAGSRFYRFKRFLDDKGIRRIQYSVFLCDDLKTAKALKEKIEELMANELGLKVDVYEARKVY